MAAAAVIAYLCALVVRPFFSVVGWSLVLAITFHPVQQWLLRKTGRRSLSALLCSALVVVLFVIPLVVVSGIAVRQLVEMGTWLQAAVAGDAPFHNAGPLRQAFEWLIHRLGLDDATVARWVTQHASDLTRLAAGYTLAVATGVIGALVSFIFIVFATFLLFRDGDRMVANIPRLLPFDRARSDALLTRIRDGIYAGVYGVVAVAVVQGVLCGLMFSILGIPSAALWGLATVVTSVIPPVGAAAVWVPGVIYLAAMGHWTPAIILAAWGAAVVSAIDNFLRPRLVAGRVGLSEFVMFLAMLGGLRAFGILGIVLGPVIFAVAAAIIDILIPSSGD